MERSTEDVRVECKLMMREHIVMMMMMKRMLRRLEIVDPRRSRMNLGNCLLLERREFEQEVPDLVKGIERIDM